MELRWKIIKANNLLQIMHQVTIEFRLRKSLAQERLKSNLEFRYQIIVSSKIFRKGFAKTTSKKWQSLTALHKAQFILHCGRTIIKLVYC